MIKKERKGEKRSSEAVRAMMKHTAANAKAFFGLFRICFLNDNKGHIKGFV